MKLLLTVAYDGANYCGWQRQQNAPSVQAELERALSVLYGREITVLGASRTDTGVHARGQRAVFTIEDNKIPLHKLAMVINAKLANDVAVYDIKEVTDEFHPIFDAKRKTYEYTFHLSSTPDPMLRNRALWVYEPLDIEKMARAASCFVGRFDFAAFCATGSSAKTTVREIYACSVLQKGNLLTLSVTGNGFLYNMVRIISGTLLDVGRGKIEEQAISGIIASCDRTKAGQTAPPWGLMLMNIEYEGGI